jgi:sulfur carrier protein ThiS
MTVIVETGKWSALYGVNESLITLAMSLGSTVADAIKAIGLPEEEAGMAVLGGKAVEKDFALSDGDSLKIHPMVFGG